MTTTLQMYGIDLKTGVTYNNLPVLVADDDFIEQLHENSFDKFIDVCELYFEYTAWERENVNG